LYIFFIISISVLTDWLFEILPAFENLPANDVLSHI